MIVGYLFVPANYLLGVSAVTPTTFASEALVVMH